MKAEAAVLMKHNSRPVRPGPQERHLRRDALRHQEHPRFDIIELTGEKGLLDPTFARQIRGMAGMRKAIVHVYWRPDYQAVYRAVTEKLADGSTELAEVLDEFARQVQCYLGESEGRV